MDETNSLDDNDKPIHKCTSSDKINIMDKSTDIVVENNELDTTYKYAIKYYFLYVSYGLFGGMIFNLINLVNIVNFDMIFNCLISPLIYYHSPRHILTKIETRDLLLYYTPSFILGLCFRFLDMIPDIRNFTLIFSSIWSSTLYTILTICVCLLVLSICIYYIVKSRYPKLNSLLFSLYILIASLSFYYLYSIGGTMHLHHYFIGLIIMLISRNYHSKLVIIIHAIAYGVFIDGITRWGFASIYSI